MLRALAPDGRQPRLGARPDARGSLRRARAAAPRDEVERCRQMSAHAAELFAPDTRALTHCNAGGLATGGYGSAVGALQTAWDRGLLAHVWVDETRPLLQGARLTAWELETAGDSAHGDRRLGRGVADGGRRGRSRRHRAPIASQRTATQRTRSARTLSRCSPPPRHPALRRRADVDRRPRDADGAAIPIEERDAAEITARFPARNPAFDVTPAELVSGDRDRARRPARTVSRRRSPGRWRVKAIILAAGYATRLRP